MSFQPGADPNVPNQARKLRFITNQGAPHPKRRRVGAACASCRRRKVACSGERPACCTCTQNKVECEGYAKRETSGGTNENKAQKSASQSKSQPEHSRYSGDDRTSSAAAMGSRTPSPQPVSTLFTSVRNRMPYFRWLGPTAIMPGFKQMVVKVHRRGPGAPSSTDEGETSTGMAGISMTSGHKTSSVYSTTPMPIESDIRTPLALPFYDTSSMPPSELITHLCETFFTHLGCNFPFLQKERFLKDLEAKQVDAILVDAVCAMAARFSTHPLLVEQADENGKSAPSEYGQAFAQRAKAALVDTYAMPNVAAVQSALLLAYNEFGEQRDSGLWMYLGISIRMAQDLGMQKLEGLRFEGREGPTPKMAKDGKDKKSRELPVSRMSPLRDCDDEKELRAVERERVDTFWSVFFLDRVVSSGVGRRSTIRDNDIELSFPSLQNTESDDGWPSPFPALIRIVHLYGRVADLLNSIKEPADMTPDTSKQLADKEAQVTDLYQGLSPRLHFEAMNFHHYVKAGEGTNFVLLHFWFHTLIILLHQPTLLKTFEGKMLQLFPNSQQLSMSSAKTIADILSYSQLVDTKASLGNPFTTQPIYIAACAFLRETAERTATSSENSPARSHSNSKAPTPVKTIFEPTDLNQAMGDNPKSKVDSAGPSSATDKSSHAAALEKSLAKHSLLVKRANQDYQMCYQALQSLETYWGGTKYILTVLDQKYKGVGDPLLYTAEEGECSLEQPAPEPAFTSPGWRRKLSFTPATTGKQEVFKAPVLPKDLARMSDKDLSQAIGWTMTGNLNSTNTNLAWHYPTQSPRKTSSTSNPGPDTGRNISQSYTQAPSQTSHGRSTSSGSMPKPPLASQQSYQSSFLTASPKMEPTMTMNPSYTPTLTGASPHNSLYSGQGASPLTFASTGAYGMPGNDSSGLFPNTNTTQFGDMIIQSQDVDMSMLGMDMLTWLDPRQGDMMDMFDTSNMGGGGAGGGVGGGSMQPPSTQPPH